MAVLAKSSQNNASTARNRLPLTHTVDTSELVRNISRLIKRETNLGVQEMEVFFEEGKLVLTGYCKTFYTKQLAQQAAVKLIGVTELVNRIRVV